MEGSRSSKICDIDFSLIMQTGWQQDVGRAGGITRHVVKL
jgi:hypothetical protein